MWSDLRQSLRTLRKSPAFAAVAVLTLGLGVGANATVFSLVNANYFRPLGFRDVERLVDVHEESATRLCAGCGVGTSYPGFEDWRGAARSFEAMGGYAEAPFALSGEGEPERVAGTMASQDLFPVLGVSPVLGRSFTPEEDRAGAPGVVLLGHELWQRRLGGDPGVVGRSVRVNGAPYTVIGVMPPGFRFPEFSDLWVPLAPHAHGRSRAERGIGVVARLAAGVPVAQAAAEMRAIARGLERAHPAEQAEWSAGVTPLRAAWASEAGRPFLTLLGAVGFVLLIVCANLAALLLSRASGRRRELAVRKALGAGRWRLVRQLLTESLVVAVLGGTLACGLAFWGVEITLSAIRVPIPYWLDFTVDGRVLAFCLGVAILSGVAAGAIPAMQASRADVNEGLRAGAPSGAGRLGRNRLRAGLIVSQMALALVLLSGAGLLVKTLVRLTGPAGDREASNVLLADLDFLDRRYGDPGQIALATEAILDRLSAQPGVLAGASHWWFLAGFGAEDRRIAVEGMREVPPGASPRFAYAVTPGFFAVQGLRLLQGRDFTLADRAGTEPVVVVNEGMAHALWGSETALGRRVQLEPGGSWATVVGVVSTLEGGGGLGPARRPMSLAYVPLAQRPGSPVQLSLRVRAAPASFAPAVRAAVRDVDPDLPVQDLRTAEEDQARTLWPVRFFAWLLSSFAGFAVLLSTLGTYGVLAYLVGQRTREFGICLAVGADRADILRMVLGQGAVLGAAGLGLGLLGVGALTPVIRALLFGTSPVDPLIMAAVALVFALVTLLASYVPARRAARVDPMVALRQE